MTETQKSHLVEAINECFELLRINYQHLYFSAFPEMDAVNAAKRLWLESLSAFSPNTIRQAIQELVKQSDFLPTISRVIKQCVKITSTSQLPDARSAYIEACNAASPKKNHHWSHPAVYYAGKLSHWFFLESSDEAAAFPVFKHHYEYLLCGVVPDFEGQYRGRSRQDPLSRHHKRARVFHSLNGILGKSALQDSVARNFGSIGTRKVKELDSVVCFESNIGWFQVPVDSKEKRQECEVNRDLRRED